jgi:hypothetical protein
MAQVPMTKRLLSSRVPPCAASKHFADQPLAIAPSDLDGVALHGFCIPPVAATRARSLT